MRRFLVSWAPLAVVLALVGGCSTVAGQHASPGGAYKPVSALVPLPEFVPGLGTLYVDPSTLPTGPYLAYDKAGHLVSTVYMVPVKDLDEHNDFKGLGAVREKVDHVDVLFNAGHPGLGEPHYHVVLWYVSREVAARLR